MRASLFRPSQDEVWTQFAEAVSGNFIDGTLPVSYTHLTLPTNREV